MDSVFDDQQPGTLAIREKIAATCAELANKNIIVTDNPTDIRFYLDEYRHTMNELVEIGPWGSYATFKESAGKTLRRLMISDKARIACAEELKQLDHLQSQAKYLFSYPETAKWISENIQSEVMSVVIPLSMFSSNPDNFRKEFLAERRKRFTRFEANPNAKQFRPLSTWKVVRQLPLEIQKNIGKWKDEYRAEKEKQGVVYPNPQSLIVEFPKGVLAKYKLLKEIEPTVTRARFTVLVEGFAYHRELSRVHPRCLKHYTGGLLLGEPKHWPDYGIGLVDVMSIPRALSLLGGKYLLSRPWRLSKEDVVWTDGTVPLYPTDKIEISRETRILLGLRNGR